MAQIDKGQNLTLRGDFGISLLLLFFSEYILVHLRVYIFFPPPDTYYQAQKVHKIQIVSSSRNTKVSLYHHDERVAKAKKITQGLFVCCVLWVEKLAAQQRQQQVILSLPVKNLATTMLA